MRRERLVYLAGKHQQSRLVVSQEVRSDGTTLFLECNHKAEIAPHFDTRHTKSYWCRECGEEFVRKSPIYAAEFVK